MATPERQELIRNASQQAPLAQRVQFLEAKGLTGPEIEEAMKQAANQTSRPPQQYQSPYPAYGPSSYPGMPPPPQQWDWRDYFITAVVSGTIAYGAMSLFRKYMLPHLKPPTATAYEQDRDALTAQFDAAEALLKDIQAETASVRAAVEEQKEKVDKATKDVEAAVTEMREGETKTRDEMREIRDEIENIREMLPKMIEKNKETQKQSLAELQQELKSLKALLLSRGSTGLTSSPSTPLPGLAGRPSIPSWQLAGTTSTIAASESLPGAASRNGSFTPPMLSNGKGKEVEVPAVESLAQPPPRQSHDNSPPGDEDNAWSRSTEVNSSRQSSPQSSTVLAENALTNLRKSLAAQRSGSPAPPRSGSPQPRAASPGPQSLPKGNSDNGLRKTTLEERLRASFAVGDASGGSTPTPSARASPSPHSVPVTQHPLSPTSTPLPESPSLPPLAVISPPATPLSTSFQLEGAGPLAPPPQAPGVPRELGVTPELNAAPELPELNPSVSSSDSQNSTSSDQVSPGSPNESAVEPPEVAPPSPRAEDSQHVVDGDPRAEAQTAGVAPSVSTPDASAPVPETEQPSESVAVAPEPSMPTKSGDADVEALQERLKLVEQRFADVSTSFKRLQAERRAADGIIRELTPLEDTKDVTALRDYLVNVNMKVELSQDELQRLNGKLTRQEERIEELRDTHRLETGSQSDQIEKLRQQLSEAEALIVASQVSASHTEEETARRKAELDQLRAEVAKAKEAAKEEEEKRVKAISLLKTVRQKLVKAEKDRDDASRELGEMKAKEGQEREKDKAEKARLQSEIDSVNLEREKAVTGLRAQFDRELALAKDRAEKEIQAARKQFETEMKALKVTFQSGTLAISTGTHQLPQTSHSAEISAKKSHVTTLENSVNNLSSENKSFFEQLQLRQAELESMQYHAESLQGQNTELQFQLRELRERTASLNDELNDLRGEQEMRSQGSGTSTEEISQLVSSVEVKYEAKLSELRRTLATAEKERTETEANWSRKLMEKTKETDELKHTLQSSTQSREQDEDVAGALKAEIEKLKNEARSQQGLLSELQTHTNAMKDAESALHRRLSDLAARAEDSDKQLEETKVREAQLRTHNKTLRDELRKVQNSVAVLERQRNPGVGYWTSRPEITDSRTSISSASDVHSPGRPASPGPSSPSPSSAKVEEEINLEYLRNVILQFLEHKEMRPNLVRVLSIILHFTPQETRRLIAKV
ncbi:hypothetical protein HYDPIDRAFT_165234 [Hydnomerulius pinastri MD-312]|nr:hypothetical protein HYDPIDRAFT_165234 [Hydnomerulius pinastri MD-312]